MEINGFMLKTQDRLSAEPGTGRKILTATEFFLSKDFRLAASFSGGYRESNF
jgi:hypothetical protein